MLLALCFYLFFGVCFTLEPIGIVFKKEEEENELERNNLNKAGSAVSLVKENVHDVCLAEEPERP